MEGFHCRSGKPILLVTAVAAILAALVRPMPLAVVIPYPFSLNVIHLLPTPGLMEVIVRHSSDDINYVELTWDRKRVTHAMSPIRSREDPDSRERHGELA